MGFCLRVRGTATTAANPPLPPAIPATCLTCSRHPSCLVPPFHSLTAPPSRAVLLPCCRLQRAPCLTKKIKGKKKKRFHCCRRNKHNGAGGGGLSRERNAYIKVARFTERMEMQLMGNKQRTCMQRAPLNLFINWDFKQSPTSTRARGRRRALAVLFTGEAAHQQPPPPSLPSFLNYGLAN